MNGNGGRRYESCPEVDRLMAQKAKQSLWTLNGYHMSLNRDVFRPLDGYNKQRELIHEYETSTDNMWSLTNLVRLLPVLLER